MTHEEFRRILFDVTDGPNREELGIGRYNEDALRDAFLRAFDEHQAAQPRYTLVVVASLGDTPWPPEDDANEDELVLLRVRNTLTKQYTGLRLSASELLEACELVEEKFDTTVSVNIFDRLSVDEVNTRLEAYREMRTLIRPDLFWDDYGYLVAAAFPVTDNPNQLPEIFFPQSGAYKMGDAL